MAGLSKKFADVNKNRCAACGTCTKVCPKGIISVFHGCYAVVDTDACVGCGKCSNICPAGCITVKERATV